MSAKMKFIERVPKPTAVENPRSARKEVAAVCNAAFELPSIQRSVGNFGMQRALGSSATQAKLAVSQPDDSFEQEAERNAALLIQSRNAGGCETCLPPKMGKAKCSKCAAEDAMVSRTVADGVNSARGSARSGLFRTLGHGEALSAANRAFFEPHFGTDFGSVRIHTGANAAESARSIKARAYTTGRDVVFGEGQYSPETDEGFRLLAHELTHVAQQALGNGETPFAQRVPLVDPYASGPNMPPTEAATPVGGEFDPCRIDEHRLDNRQLLQHFHRAESYLNNLIEAHRRGEDRFYDYNNLLNRLRAERRVRIRAGHRWLANNLNDVPARLYRLASGMLSNMLLVTPVNSQEAVASAPVSNGIIVTPNQFSELLEREHIPTVNPEEFFARQDPRAPQPLQLQVPERRPRTASPSVFGTSGAVDPFDRDARAMDGLFSFPPLATGLARWQSPMAMHVWEPFAPPVVTAGPHGFTPDQVSGFRIDWRGDIGEARFAARDPETLRVLQDLNRVQTNFPLYDPYDPRTDSFISIKTQLPDTAGGAASLASAQEAWGEIFGSANPAKRANALLLLQNNVDSTLTMDRLLLNTQIAVNPENVATAQDSLEIAIRRGQASYEPLLTALLRQQSVSVQHKNGTIVVYTDFGTLHANFIAKLMAESRYRAAVAELAQRARTRIISNASGAETHLRPLLNYRQRYDFTGASDFANFPGTAAGRQQTRALQELYFRRMAVPELMDAQTGGVTPILRTSARTGGAFGAGTAAALQLPGTISNWNTDPYAGRRYLTNIALGGGGGAAQGAADEAWRLSASQLGLNWAASRAAAGESVAALSYFTPAARFGGSSVLGGVAAGGTTLAGMYIDERYFNIDYTAIDYRARVTRAFVSGTVASGVGALASAGTAAYLGGAGGAGACTVVVPGVGTLACGTVGTIGGFIVGLGAYYLFDYTFGEAIEGEVREQMGEAGCTH